MYKNRVKNDKNCLEFPNLFLRTRRSRAGKFKLIYWFLNIPAPFYAEFPPFPRLKFFIFFFSTQFFIYLTYPFLDGLKPLLKPIIPDVIKMIPVQVSQITEWKFVPVDIIK